ncbi:hypothetical protein HS048_35165 [Planomonospora sp. ID91781]|uniref:hypothetical protein n=1 Tax=Planomonospora sp. ID91781 TaxID=2738135 RepID=UPI0018C3FB8D|nr:hypothetical protein [Planomonospora sp. ID91781]MBG0825916.1 hypothetical protein [Planomonospora sp. ID91781]
MDLLLRLPDDPAPPPVAIGTHPAGVALYAGQRVRFTFPDRLGGSGVGALAGPGPGGTVIVDFYGSRSRIAPAAIRAICIERPAIAERHTAMNDTTGIYDDGATYGADPHAVDPDSTGERLYDDGAAYGPAC